MTTDQRLDYLAKFRAFWDERYNYEGSPGLEELAKQIYDEGRSLVDLQQALGWTDEELTESPAYWAGVHLGRVAE